MLQNLLVGAIVGVAVAYTVWALVPGTTRLGLARMLGAWGREPGRPAWIERVTGAVEQAAGRRHGGCSGCSSVPPDKPPRREPPGR
jgi:antibiotic biosynthesis monooxygenase (ABM) superfamily enzyme